MIKLAPVRAPLGLLMAALFACLFGPLVHARPAQQEPPRESVASRPASEEPQQDEVKALSDDKREWWEIKDSARVLWEKKENRDPMVALLREPGLRLEVFTGVAVHLAAVNERSVIGSVIETIAARDLGELRDTVGRSVIGAFHRNGSLMAEIEGALERLSANPGTAVGPGFARIAALLPFLVEVAPSSGGVLPDAVRYQAIERLLILWAKPGNAGDASVGQTIRTQLALLAGGLVDLQSAAEWKAWFERFKSDSERDRVLSLQRIGQDSIQILTGRIELLVALRRRELTDLFGRMKDADTPPTSYLLDSDAAVRKIALRTLREMKDSMALERRLPAVQELTRLLERGDLDDDRRKTLLDAAGAMGRKLAEKERRDLAAAIFTGPEGLGPEVWRARLAAIAEIGAIDDPGRLVGLYELASAPGRGADKAWMDVRADVIRACSTLRLDFDLLLRGLRDASEDVRGIAASTLAVEQTAWTKELASTLVAAAVDEQASNALTRMLEALRNIGRERADLLDKSLLVQLIGIQERASEANDARILGIILHAALSVEAEAAPEEVLVDDLLRNVFAGGASPADRGRLVEQILASSRPLAAHLIGILLIETPTALDHAQIDRGVALILAQPAGIVSARSLVEIAGRIWGRADIPTVHRAREAAKLAGAGLARIQAGESADSLDLADLERRLESWRLASGDADLIAEARAALDARVAEQPDAPEPLLRRAVFFEGLQAATDGEGTELLQAAEADLRRALAHSGAMDEPTLQAFYLRLVRILLLQGKYEDFAAEIDRAGPAREALLLRHIAAVMTVPGEAAFAVLAGVGDEQQGCSPETYAVLRAAARALSPRVDDRLVVSDALNGTSDPFLRELDGECRNLIDLDALVGQALTGAISEEDRAKLAARPRVAAALAARRLLALHDEDLKTNSGTWVPLVANWVPEVAPAITFAENEGDAALSRARTALEPLTLMEVGGQKRPARFLKLLARTLYSP